MPSTSFSRYYNFEVLRFVRDNQPTEATLLEFFGGEPWQAQADYAALRRSGMVIQQEGHWVLLPENLSSDGRFFRWGNQCFDLNENTIMTY